MIYALVIGSTILFTFLYTRTQGSLKVILYIISVAIPICFSGLRMVGTDYFNYRDRYFLIKAGLPASATDSSLLYVMMRVVQQLGGSYQVVIFLVSCLTILCFSVSMMMMKSVISIPLAMTAFMLMFYQLSFNIFRQICAAMLVLLGSLVIMKNAIEYSLHGRMKNIVQLACAVVIVLLGMLLHSSCIFLVISIAVFMIAKIVRPHTDFIVWYILVAFIVLSLPVMNNVITFFLTHFAHYGYYFVNFEYRSPGIGIIRYFILVGVPVVVMIYEKSQRFQRIPNHLQDAGENDDFQTWSLDFCVFLSVTGSILFLLSYVSTSVLYRVAFNELITVPLLISAAYQQLKRPLSRLCYGSGLLLVLLFFWWYDFFYLGTGETVPYLSCV